MQHAVVVCLAAALLSLFSPAAVAQAPGETSESVNCTSLPGALATAARNYPLPTASNRPKHTIFFSGDCEGPVVIYRQLRLVLDGQNQGRIIQGGNPSGEPLLQILESSGITVKQMTIEPGQANPARRVLIRALGGWGVFNNEINGVTLKSGVNGLMVQQGATVTVRNVTIDDMTGSGCVISEGARAALGGFARISNVQQGILVNGGRMDFSGPELSITNASVAGALVQYGSTLTVGGCNNASVISGAKTGVLVDGWAGIACPISIAHNSVEGVSGLGTVLLFNGATVSGNPVGVRMYGGGRAHVGGGVISGNTGVGLQLDRGSSGIVFDSASITGNGAEGVLVEHTSSLALSNEDRPVQITGNGGNKDLVCDQTSSAYGDKPIGARIQCAAFDQTRKPKKEDTPEFP